MNKPLHGIKVLDFSRLLPGPFCSYILADMGASLHVVHPPQDHEVLSFPALRKGKKFIALDLKLEKNRAKIEKLIQNSDVLLEGFRPGVMKRLGLDFKVVKKLNPQIIYASLTGYGQSGANRAGHDLNYLASSGVLKALYPLQNIPSIPGIPLADLVGGIEAALQILAALVSTSRKRKSLYLDISMTEAVGKLLIPLDVKARKEINKVLSGNLARYHLYECSDGESLALAPLEEKFWQKFIQQMGVPTEVLKRGEASLIQYLEKQFLTQPLKYWLHKLADPDLCVSAVK